MSNKNPLKSWAWDYFHDSGSKYKGDKTHHEARCLGCIRDHEKVLEDQQRERLELGTLQPDRLKDTAALRKEAIRATEPIRGRVDVMKRHIKKCELVKQAAKDRLAAEEIEKQSDAAQEDADSSDHPATARPPGPIQTLFKVAKNKPFTPAAQAEFERDFLKLLIVMNVAMLAANDPYVKHFFEKYVPGARLPDRKQLSNRILDDEVNHVTAAVASDVKGQYATGTVDGWSTKKDAVQCTGLNVGGKEYPGRIHVTTPEQKTSANLLQHVLSDIQWMVATLGIIIVAWCCDSGGDSRGLRPLLVALMPWILAIPCWGHQLNLVVYDYVHRAGDWISETLSKCAIIINWFTSHKRALSMLMDEERRSPEQWTRLKTFIRAVITRWTTHYLSVRRMAELREVLQVLAIVRRSQLLLAGGEKQEQIDAADGVIKIVEDGSFWTNIDVLKRYLEPLAIAANVAQGSSTRLDHVLVTLASLHHTYSTKTEYGEYDRLEDNAIIIASLEKRWAALKRDQDFYIIAVFLHPQFRAHFFDDTTHSLSRAGLYAVLKRVYRRVFRVPEDDEMPPGLFESYCQYYDGTGRYTSEGFSLQEWRNEFKRQV
ncbi:hypothetical protein K525DRAFT_205497 [Schizophyllum commune Loenen D]|nr:hypothetical protein K525DRAFT_205497 [Schizophyllum commune Loenen D]